MCSWMFMKNQYPTLLGQHMQCNSGRHTINNSEFTEKVKRPMV